MKVSCIPDDVASAVEQKFGVTPVQTNRAKQILLLGQFWFLPNGNLEVSSQSRKGYFHQVNPLTNTCTCERATFGKKVCIHLIAWYLLRDLPVRLLQFYPANTVRLPAQPNPIAERELRAVAQRPARTEWLEEIDL